MCSYAARPSKQPVCGLNLQEGIVKLMLAVATGNMAGGTSGLKTVRPMRVLCYAHLSALAGPKPPQEPAVWRSHRQQRRVPQGAGASGQRCQHASAASGLAVLAQDGILLGLNGMGKPASPMLHFNSSRENPPSAGGAAPGCRSSKLGSGFKAAVLRERTSPLGMVCLRRVARCPLLVSTLCVLP